MPAKLITRYRNVSADGALVELVVWQLPEPVPPSEHGFKYRLVYIIEGKRVIGFDNERGKGDHLHRADAELPYNFVSIEQLLNDFFAEVEAWKNAH